MNLGVSLSSPALSEARVLFDQFLNQAMVEMIAKNVTECTVSLKLDIHRFANAEMVGFDDTVYHDNLYFHHECNYKISFDAKQKGSNPKNYELVRNLDGGFSVVDEENQMSMFDETKGMNPDGRKPEKAAKSGEGVFEAVP